VLLDGGAGIWPHQVCGPLDVYHGAKGWSPPGRQSVECARAHYPGYRPVPRVRQVVDAGPSPTGGFPTGAVPAFSQNARP